MLPSDKLIRKRDYLVAVSVDIHSVRNPCCLELHTSCFVKRVASVYLHSHLNRKNRLIIGKIVEAHNISSRYRNINGECHGVTCLHGKHVIHIFIIIIGKKSSVCLSDSLTYLIDNSITCVYRFLIALAYRGIIGCKPVLLRRVLSCCHSCRRLLIHLRLCMYRHGRVWECAGYHGSNKCK